MLVFPNAKINLGLRILSKREDGFHDLESIFFPVPWNDALEIALDRTGKPGEIRLRTTGLPVPGVAADNLVLKAYRLLHEKKPLPAIKVHLHKVIPMGGGLGGGSADGAFMLVALNDLLELRYALDELEKLAAELGSDCPFFIRNKPAFVSGRGELLSPIRLNLPFARLLLVNPGIHVHTGTAFSGVVPAVHTSDLKTVINTPSQWAQHLKNDFEKTVYQMHPELKQLKETLLQAGADYVSMTGTGSTHYAFFKKEIPALPALKKYTIWQGRPG